MAPLLYGQRAGGGQGVAFDLLGFAFLQLNLYPMSKLGLQKTNGAPVTLPWFSLHSISRAGYTSLKFTICNMKLEENEKCWQPAPSREMMYPLMDT